MNNTDQEITTEAVAEEIYAEPASWKKINGQYSSYWE